MASDVPETRSDSGDDYKRLLALLNDYGISERLQRLLALQLAGGCTRTENGKSVRGEINLQLVVDPIVDQTGLLELLSELMPNSTTINGTDVSFGGLFANASGGSLENGVLLDDQYDWYFLYQASDLSHQSVRALGGLLNSGTHTVTKSGIHERLENHASHLLIDTPKYGHWDSYEPLVEQISPYGEISSKVDLVAASSSPEPVSYDIEAFTVDEAAEYLDAVRMITPTVSEALAEEIVASTHRMNEVIEEADVPLQIHPNAVRRLTEANARLTSSETVEESHLIDVVELIEDCLEQLGVATEEEGEYDVEVIETERAKTDHEHVKGIKTIIRELQEMYDSECGAPEEKVYQHAGQQGMSPKRTKHEIQKLHDKGEVYSPDQDHLRLV